MIPTFFQMSFASPQIIPTMTASVGVFLPTAGSLDRLGYTISAYDSYFQGNATSTAELNYFQYGRFFGEVPTEIMPQSADDVVRSLTKELKNRQDFPWWISGGAKVAGFKSAEFYFAGDAIKQDKVSSISTLSDDDSGGTQGGITDKGGGTVQRQRHNYYDDPTFHSSYTGMRDKTHSANDHIEKPSLERILPDAKGKTVLDLGCGMGDYIINFLRSAAHVDAVDISRNMLERLQLRMAGSGLTQRVSLFESSIEDFDFRQEYYDLVLSTLAFHYIENLFPVFANIYKSLKKGGLFIFNVEHPIYTSTKNQGWEVGANGKSNHWRLDNYFERGARRVRWHGIEVERYHRTVEDYFNLLINNGFRVEKIVEPEPSDEARRLDPELNRHHRRPPFLMFLARKE